MKSSCVSKIPQWKAKNKKKMRKIVSMLRCTFELSALLSKKFHLHLHCYILVQPVPEKTRNFWMVIEMQNTMQIGITPVAGPIFGPFSQSFFYERVFMNEISSSALLDWCPTDITLCLWSGFIDPQIRIFDRNFFYGLFSEQKPLKLRSWKIVHEMKLGSTSSAQKNFHDEITWMTWKTK